MLAKTNPATPSVKMPRVESARVSRPLSAMAITSVIKYAVWIQLSRSIGMPRACEILGNAAATI